ncbi:heme biosynthesis HemY N-terminal domain-containing protein [Paraferrimonas haliotis]|uniref:Heme biosynthesis protein HemY n=1 Tax=Paraferrimonas haliotis TaxID=2013866 RepID=A0AA37TS94_9GAMM|nr:heme biosynthesis HemY N-terminal domain-containing protein [Paraferrimonas haliotis]GLS82239.1 heme biosynthesis protein HemY [Paraferrimonas haliotis]
MIRVFAYLILILAGMILAPYIIQNKGYVLVAIGDYTIESSVIALLIVAILFFSALQLTEWLIVAIINTLLSSRYLPERWRKKAARKHTLSGALALAEEDWAQAEASMIKGADKGELPALNYLAAARAAQQQGNHANRDRYLAQAQQQPNARQAALVAQVRYQLQQGEVAQARNILNQLSISAKSKPSLLALAKEVYLCQKDWPLLRLLLPVLKKKHVIDEEQARQLLTQVDLGELQTEHNHSLDELRKHWHWMPRAERNKPAIKAEYCKQLARFDAKEAHQLLVKQLKQVQDAATLDAVAELMTWQDNPKLQNLLLSLHNQHPESAPLNECIGRLLLKERLYKQAKPYWQTCCNIAPTKARWLTLAEIQENQGEQYAAIASFKKAAHL